MPENPLISQALTPRPYTRGISGQDVTTLKERDNSL